MGFDLEADIAHEMTAAARGNKNDTSDGLSASAIQISDYAEISYLPRHAKDIVQTPQGIAYAIDD